MDSRRAELALSSSRIIAAGCLPSARCAQLDRASLIERPPNKALEAVGAGLQGKRTFVPQPTDTAGRRACARRRSPRSLSAIR